MSTGTISSMLVFGSRAQTGTVWHIVVERRTRAASCSIHLELHTARQAHLLPCVVLQNIHHLPLLIPLLTSSHSKHIIEHVQGLVKRYDLDKFTEKPQGREIIKLPGYVEMI